MIDVTFSRTTRTVDDAGGGSTESTVTIAANAAKVRPNRSGEMRYQQLGITLSKAIVLLTATATYGDRILPGDTVVWAGETWTVKDVDEVAPDGVTIISRVACIQ